MKTSYAFLAGVLAVGCTFPEVSFDAGAGGGAGAGAGAGSMSSTQSTSGSMSTSVSGSTSSAMACFSDSWGMDCDDDGDNYAKLGGPCCLDSSADDCDDNDPNVHPNQMAFFLTESLTQGFDYDCSGVLEPKHLPGFCSDLDCSPPAAQDPPPRWFPPADPPPCGTTVDIAYCPMAGGCDMTTATEMLECH